MVYFMKQSSRFKVLWNSAFVERRILHNLFLTRNSCNECERQNLSNNVYTPGTNLKSEICSKHLAMLLNCSHMTAVSLMADCPEISSRNPFDIKESFSFLLQHFDMKSILKNPRVFLIRSLTVGERIQILREIGTINITTDNISRFNTLMKQSMKTLNKEKIIFSTDEIISNMLADLDCPEDISSVLKSKISLKSINISTPRDIRAHVIKRYLQWKLQCDFSTIKRISKLYSNIFCRSCNTLKQTLKILCDSYHFSEERICANGFVLTYYPANLQRILHSVPILAGMDIRSFARKVPRILGKSPEELLMAEKIAREHNYTIEQLKNCILVYNLKSSTIQQRLEVIDNEEELAIRKFLPNILCAVYSHKLILHRLKELKENNIASISLINLLNTEKYQEVVKLSCTYQLSVEIFHYLALIFNKTKNEVRNKINEHQSIKNGSLSNTKMVTEYLLNNGISKEQIWHGIYIVLYSIDAVKRQFEKLPDYEELHPFSEWEAHPNFVNLLIYYIEKESDLTLENPTGKSETIIQKQLEASVND